MEHAKKMILMPPEVVERMKNNFQQRDFANPRSALDMEMETLLHRQGISDEDKWNQYYQVLNKYLYLVKQQREPISIPIISQKEDNDANNIERQEDHSPSVHQELSLSIPLPYRTKARLLHDRLIKNSNIFWTNDGTVFIHNKKIPRSNIIDLISDAVRPRKATNPPGWQVFSNLLATTNVPQEYIGNPRRQEFILRQQSGHAQHVQPSTSTSTSSSLSPPLSLLYRSPPKKKVKRERKRPVWSVYKP